ncbi:L-erythro-3,5-diaminohexanoate dehydrogenase [Bacteriovoracaceae bacterium]|nr:L-erythro-3,5-diaminohexanoate dehydrogenase [Bacteriovoracaceae bacterium]
MSHSHSLCPYGSNRVITPKNTLPQNADKLDNSLPINLNEILIDVEYLNIDAASFRQMSTACHNSKQGIELIIKNTVSERGKQHNPVTGSGGMLLGTVKEIGSKYPNHKKFIVGERIVSLVSLTLTPLFLKEINILDLDKDQAKVSGHAIFPPTSNLARVPKNIPLKVILALFDVAGAPAQTLQLVQQDHNVIIVGGGGKSGLLCAMAARDQLGTTGKLIAIEPNKEAAARLDALNICDVILEIDAQNPLMCKDAIAEITKNHLGDIVINCTNAPDTEMSCVLMTNNQGTVYFFSMATDFAKVALGAEGVSSTAKLLIGNGYYPNNEMISLALLERHENLFNLFHTLYS